MKHRSLRFTLILTLLCMACGGAWAQAGADNSGQGLGYICEGTEWITYTAKFIDFWDYEKQTIVESLQGKEEINGRTYMVLWSEVLEEDKAPHVIGYIRTEGDKVFFLKDTDSSTQEFLLFDYSIQEGVSQNFVPSFYGQTGWWGTEYTTVKCLATGNMAGEIESFETMKVEFFANGQPLQEDVITPIKWIRGIGGEYGITNNFLNVGLVSEVYHDGILVYKAQNGGSGVESVADDDARSGLAGRRYHIDGREFKDGDTGVCIENGRKTIR